MVGQNGNNTPFAAVSLTSDNGPASPPPGKRHCLVVLSKISMSVILEAEEIMLKLLF